MPIARRTGGSCQTTRLREIQARHWRALASRVGSWKLRQRMQELVATADAKVESVRERLPAQFPERVIDTIEQGVREQATIFLAGAAA